MCLCVNPSFPYGIHREKKVIILKKPIGRNFRECENKRQNVEHDRDYGTVLDAKKNILF